MRMIILSLFSLLMTMIPIQIHDNTQPEAIVRPATQAGRFYESDPEILSHEVDSFLNNHAPCTDERRLAAIIVPHAGYVFSGNVAAAAFMRIDPKQRYERIFLIGPSHHEWLDGASVNFAVDQYQTPLGRVAVDRATGRQLASADPVFHYEEKAHDREHCLEVQLPFLQRRLPTVPPIVPIVVSTNDWRKLNRIADVLRPYFNDKNLFVISSDFSHYPSYNDACRVDENTKNALLTGDVERFIKVLEDNAHRGIRNLATSACGEFAIISLMLLLDKQYDIVHLLYQNSGDADFHGRDRVVGYHAFAVYRKNSNPSRTESDSFSLSEEDKLKLKTIALNSLKSAFGLPVDTVCVGSSVLQRKCGAFVTLTKNGRLRGCIGYFGEDVALHELVQEMAQAAAFEDHRFSPLRRDELPDIKVEISVLTPRRRIHSLDEFQLHKHGIYIRKGDRSGTFLPQVADEVNWTKEEFVGHCAQDKAGIGWNGWRDAEMYVYEAIVF